MMRVIRTLGLVGALALPAAAARSPAADTLRVVAGGRDSVLTLESVNGSRMVEAAPLVRLLGGTLDSPDRLRFRVKLKGFEAELVAGMPFFKVGETTWPLGNAPAMSRDRLYLPMQFVADNLPRLARDVEYDAEKGVLRGAPAPAVPATATTPGRPPRQKVVVVDAGHGGIDGGMCARLPDGRIVHEKTIALGIAQKVAIALRDKGHKAVMTRERDTLIALADRGAIANRAAGDLFLSIHVNSAATRECRTATRRGFETYFLSEARTEDERRVEALENEVTRFESGPAATAGDALSFLLADMVQNEHLRESSELAETVQRHLTSRGHPGPDRGVKQAGFAVLVHAFMPAVLIETGFGSNQTEARWLASGEGQSVLANAIANAAHEYLRNYDRRVGSVPK
jgi:N-acetylmuramoyl-L-alanine amidase